MTEQTKPVSRRWLYIPYALAAIAVVAYFLLWNFAATKMQKGVEEWAADQAEAGFSVSYKEIKRDGFPFFLRTHVEEPLIIKPGEFSWRADRLSMDALPYDLDKLIFSPSGEQALWVDGYGDWRLSAEDFRISVANDKDRDWVLGITIGSLKGVRVTDEFSASLGSLVLDLAPAAEMPSTLHLNLLAKQVTTQVSAEEVQIDAFQSVVAITQVDALSGKTPTQSWRVSGGVLDITAIVAQTGDAHFSTAGKVKLDADGYPSGQLQTQVKTPAAFTTIMENAGVITESEEKAAAAALTLAAIASGGEINAPIHLQNGEAQIAGVKITALPQVK